jgi:four helix bundle suffix protein
LTAQQHFATGSSTAAPAPMTRWCRQRGAANHAFGVTEGSMASGTSKKSELKLIGVARASLEELLVDFQDYLRQHGLPLWGKEHPKAREVRAKCYEKNRSYQTYRTYFESSPEIAANAMICLIHQTNYLLDQQLRALEKEFLKEGGFTERLYRMRSQMRDGRRKP